MNIGTILQVATGVAAITGGPLAIAIFNWWTSRSARKAEQETGAVKAHTDNAQVVQGMTLALLAPLQQQVKDLGAEVERLTGRVQTVTNDLDKEREYRRLVEDERDDAYDVLQAHRLPIPAPRTGPQDFPPRHRSGAGRSTTTDPSNN